MIGEQAATMSAGGVGWGIARRGPGQHTNRPDINRPAHQEVEVARPPLPVAGDRVYAPSVKVIKVTRARGAARPAGGAGTGGRHSRAGSDPVGGR